MDAIQSRPRQRLIDWTMFMVAASVLLPLVSLFPGISKF